ncbi:MAG TPA: ABC transporter substrate-binding protein [Burkholderiales bacterium]
MKRLWMQAAAAAAALCLATGAAFAQPAVPRLDEPATVKLGWTLGSITLAGVYVAMEKGYFRDANINVELVTVDNINALIAPIATGQIDIATGGPSAGFFNALARGVKLRIVADQNTARPGMSSIALMVRKDLIDDGQVKTYADLRGRTIAVVSKRATMELDVLKALKMGGLTKADVNMVNMGFPQMNLAFGSKNIDAALQIEPLVTAAVAKNLAVRWKGVDEITPNRQNSFFIVSESFAARRDVARAYMVAYLRGVRDYYDGIHKKKANRGEIIGILTRHTLVKDPAIYEKMIMPGIDPNGELNVASIQEALDQFTADGDVKAKIDLDKVVDVSLIRYGQKVLGRYEP